MKASDKTAPNQALGCKVKQKKDPTLWIQFPESQLSQSPRQFCCDQRNHRFPQSRISESYAASLFLNKRCCQGVQKFPF